MARTKTDKKTKPPAKRRGGGNLTPAGKAAVAKAPERARKAGVPLDLPGVPTGRQVKLEELGVQMREAKEQVRAERDVLKGIEVRAVEVMQKLGLTAYTTADGYRFTAEPKTKLSLKKAPKSKRERRVAA
jgi:hypothetical protein